MATSKVHVKTGDSVIVLSGKDKGKKGKVQRCIPSEDRVVISGVNMVTRHKKPRSAREQGGIIKMEAPIAACKVMLVCKSCGQATRVNHTIAPDGAKQRICKKCGKPVDR